MVEFDAWLREYASESDDPFIQQAEEMLSYFFTLAAELPAEYGWRAMDEDGFERRLRSLDRPTPDQLNAIYWQDMARSIEAYIILVVWRTSELAYDATSLLNQKKILPPALCARAMIELACYSLWNLNIIHKTVCDMVGRSISEDAVIASEDLEELVNRMLYGTRWGALDSNPKQTNILTYIEKMGRNPNAKHIPDLYSFLCDVTHPNILGNARFWGISVAKDAYSTTMRIERNAEFVVTSEIRGKVLSSLGWSAACVRNAFEIGRDALLRILQKWPRLN